MSAPPKRYFTAEEYLLLEERSPYKSQYIYGEIFPMGDNVVGEHAGRPSMMRGAAPAHVLNASNFIASLNLQFRGRSCRVFGSDMRAAAAPGDIYTYPDVAVACGEPRYGFTRPPLVC